MTDQPIFSDIFLTREWWKWLWKEIKRTANPNVANEVDRHAGTDARLAAFESLNYQKSYSAVYVKHLRQHHRRRREFHQTRLDARTANEEPFRVEGDNSSFLGIPSGEDISTHINQMTVVNDEEERNTVIRWLLHVLIALSVGVVAAVVTYSVEIVEHLREVILHFFLTGMPLSVVGYTLGWLFMVLTAIALTACASAVVVFYEPAAAGGGIPDIMAYLNGVHLRRAMNLKTFLAKAASCICAVASGMPVGLEAPLIHLGGITGAGVTQGRSRTLGFQTTWLQSFRSNEDRRDFITAGAACGVSAAFGAPIGGLLFVMEEVSSFWNLVSSGQIFLATMVCFTFITIINSIVEGKSLLGWVTNSASVLFEVNVGIPLNLMSVLPSLLLGAILGGLAALFTKANLVLTRWRRENLKPFPKRRFLEPIVLTGLFTCIMYLLATFSFCRYISSPYTGYSNSIRWGTESADRLFCAMCGEDSNRYSPFGSLSLASGKNVIRHLFTRQTAGEFPLYVLVMYFVLYFVFACLCCGTSVSGGLVVPSLVIGALFGRIFGLVLFYVGSDVNRGGYYSTKYSWMDPGLFALIGAGAFLAGTSRMTMSICVIMVELSSELHYLLPVMVAIVMSKTVADWLSEPLYHHMLHMDCIPYLGPALSHPEFEQLTAADVMATPLTSLRLREKTSVVLDALRNTPHNAFPIYENKTKRGGSVHQKFIGLVTREDLQVYLTLPQLRQCSTGTSPGEDHLYDGTQTSALDRFLDRMTWADWLHHKSSLFLKADDRYSWIQNNLPDSNNSAGALPPSVNLSIIVNRSPWCVPPYFNLQMAYNTFRLMGLRHMVVVDGEEARGMITRKDLLTPSLLCRLEELQEQLASARNSEAEEESGRGESAVVGMTPPVNETAAPSGVGNENSAKEGETAPPPAEAPAAGAQQNDELLDDLFR